VGKALREALWATETLIETFNPARACTHTAGPLADSQEWIDQGPVRGVAPKRAAAPSPEPYLPPTEVAKASAASRPAGLKSPSPPRKHKARKRGHRDTRRSPSGALSEESGEHRDQPPRLHPSAKQGPSSSGATGVAPPVDRRSPVHSDENSLSIEEPRGASKSTSQFGDSPERRSPSPHRERDRREEAEQRRPRTPSTPRSEESRGGPRRAEGGPVIPGGHSRGGPGDYRHEKGKSGKGKGRGKGKGKGKGKGDRRQHTPGEQRHRADSGGRYVKNKGRKRRGLSPLPETDKRRSDISRHKRGKGSGEDH
jgi:hypothetical protein